MAGRISFTRVQRASRSVLMVPAIVVVAGSCELFLGPDEVGSVGITVGPPGHTSDAVLTVGELDTIRAQAYSDGWPSRVMHDSENGPRRFQYSSSDPAVASIDMDGILSLETVGTTILTASTAGKTSLPLTLHVVPAASELRVTPTALDAAIGDTMAITVTAHDAAGAQVDGVLFYISTDATHWVITSPPIPDAGYPRTPSVVRFRANAPGTARVTVYTWNDRPTARLSAGPVTIQVGAP